MADDEKAPIIIKKVKKNAGGHHGGAWKVAYADFVTAMMAFFLLLWLLNVSTDEQKALISSYFSPADPRVAVSQSGSGGVLGGLTISEDGAMTSNKTPLVAHPGALTASNRSARTEVDGDLNESSDAELVKEMERRDEERFKSAEESLRQAIASQDDLKALAQNLLIDQTPEGLRIQIIDQEGKPMFPLGGILPLEDARLLLKLVTKVIMDMPNMISIRGHTDSRPYGTGAKYTNWELSADRANASRRVMLESTLDIKRIENVMGKADREHLLIDEPNSPRNRRISIILLRESIVPGIHNEEEKVDNPLVEKKEEHKVKVKPTYNEKRIVKPQEHEDGIIYFP